MKETAAFVLLGITVALSACRVLFDLVFFEVIVSNLGCLFPHEREGVERGEVKEGLEELPQCGPHLVLLTVSLATQVDSR